MTNTAYKQVTSYIDNLILDNCNKPTDILNLSVHDLKDHDQTNLLDFLFEKDPEFRQKIQGIMNEKISNRLTLVETKYNFKLGLLPSIDPITGSVSWSTNRARA